MPVPDSIDALPNVCFVCEQPPKVQGYAYNDTRRFKCTECDVWWVNHHPPTYSYTRQQQSQCRGNDAEESRESRSR